MHPHQNHRYAQSDSLSDFGQVDKPKVFAKTFVENKGRRVIHDMGKPTAGLVDVLKKCQVTLKLAELRVSTARAVSFNDELSKEHR